MPCGDYVKCANQNCSNSTIYGTPLCSNCMTRLGTPPETYSLPMKNYYPSLKRASDETLNQIVDDLFGPAPKRPIKRLTKTSPVESTDEFEAFFKGSDVGPKCEQPDRNKTLVVNFFGGPGCGKSTTCAGVFYDLKTLGIECEVAAEYAKDLVWEKRNFTFEDQIYLFAKQNHRIHNLLGQVKVVLTDCPILLSPVYDAQRRPTFEKLVVEQHNSMWTYNVYMRRTTSYNPVGRIHTAAQARDIDRAVINVLDKHDQLYEVADANDLGKNKIVHKIKLLLSGNTKDQYFKPMPPSEKASWWRR